MKMTYKQFFFTLMAHFVAMYLIMYTMINSISDFYININQLYMTLMMVTSMAALMLWSMRKMYDKKMVRNLMVGSLTIFILSFLAMRDQTFVANKQFLRSMVPHHSGAILMCERSNISDPEIVELCEFIVDSQQKEIGQMKKILDRL